MFTFNTRNYAGVVACTHARLGFVETSLCVYVCVFVEGIYTCKSWHFVVVGGNYTCNNGHFGIDTLCLCSFVVEGMYKCKTWHFGIDSLCLCLCCCRKYIHM